ncbi:DC1 [Arabidopsis thaliana x Arabidopsis arenosa]|uniref:Zinc finger PHD-type domain-containing protein n=2 Tax=Arabidopsis TaxID=3701 RepID=A0A178V277_ARATH|nr:DC1 [Arabidopsis thaliana x Arabidopsis arenosa]OAO99737.1 hypothetical protein AXX17_AT4G30420 [Arabidopsis thaliana]CAA0396565.1 unnamed protein product [Arabidopsis thaliana]
MDSESELMISLISQLLSILGGGEDTHTPQLKSKLIALTCQLISLVNSLDLDSQPEPESKLKSLIKQIIYVSNSVSEPGPESQSVSVVTKMISIIGSIDFDLKESEPELMSLTSQIFALIMAMDEESELFSLLSEVASLVQTEEQKLINNQQVPPLTTEEEEKDDLIYGYTDDMNWESELMFYIISKMISTLRGEDMCQEVARDFIAYANQLIPLIESLDMDSNSEPKQEPKITSLVRQIISLSKVVSGPESQLVSLVTRIISITSSTDLDPTESQWRLTSVTYKISRILKEIKDSEDSEMASLINQIHDLVDAEEGRKPESRLISSITQLMSHINSWSFYSGMDPKIISLIIRIIYLVRSMDLDSQTKPKSELMSLVTQTIAVYNSMDLDSQPRPLRKLVSVFSQYGFDVNSTVSDSESDSSENYVSHIKDSLKLEPEPELISFIHRIGSLVISMNPNWEKLISFCPQFEVILSDDGKFQVEEGRLSKNQLSDDIPMKWNCLQVNWNLLKLHAGEKDFTHFRCRGCNGDNHKENEKAPLEVKHPLHPKHPLQLVLSQSSGGRTRECYCCDEDLLHIFYCCLACNFSMNVACTKKPAVLYRDHPRWHEHTLALFPRQASLTCNLCALADSSSPIYMCPPCDFVVHLRCTGLPRVIKISRHLHRISFTFSFDRGDLSCSVCRRKIDEDYGGYTCIKDGCSYAAHSKCATQKNVWDGIELEGEPEEVEEEVVDPFVTISDGVIQHFGHPQHHLRLDENTSRDYDEDKLCQACVMPIYFGNFYSCTQCNYILHEACANFSRKMHHPVHPHVLTLVNSDGAINVRKECAACPWMCTTGFFYECSKEDFQLHVQCANLSEPLVHESHMHPLFLTSKPGERRLCSACKESYFSVTRETFNCIECDFALCFRCATLPQKVRYKHDKHMLTLSYGEETSTMTYWCEVCERNLNPKERFYKCDEYCSITLHIECMLGVALYIRPGSSWICFNNKKILIKMKAKKVAYTGIEPVTFALLARRSNQLS